MTHYCRRGEVFIRKSRFLIGNYRVFKPVTLVDITGSQLLISLSPIIMELENVVILKGNELLFEGPIFHFHEEENAINCCVLNQRGDGKKKQESETRCCLKMRGSAPKNPAQNDKVCLSSS